MKTRPEIVGLAAPGMPPKSPGMQPESEMPADYDVLSFDKNGQTSNAPAKARNAGLFVITRYRF